MSLKQAQRKVWVEGRPVGIGVEEWRGETRELKASTENITG